MNWRAWRCWFKEHQFSWKEIGLDPKEPEKSAAILDYISSSAFDGHPLGLNICTRCGALDGTGPLIQDGVRGVITTEEYLERRYRESMEAIVRRVEDEQGGRTRTRCDHQCTESQRPACTSP
jgi:hypothetical protein